MNSPFFYTSFQIVAGVGDTVTGLLLVVSPRLALRAMGVRNIPLDPVFISFIGVFVLSVGLSYLLFLRYPKTSDDISAVRTLWLLTGIERFAVSLFVLVAVVSRQLEGMWLIVSAFDFLFAGFQLGILRPTFAKLAQ